jgi:hypothetical protein
LESAEDPEVRLIQERFYDGSMMLALNEKKGIAVAFEAYDGIKNPELRQLNIETAREWLSDYDLAPFMEADLDRSDIIAGMVQARSNQNSREQQLLTQRIQNGRRAPSLTEQDVKKSNDMQPYAIQVRLNVINENNEFVEYWDIVVGVKTILHLIKSDEIVENIARAVQNRSLLFNMIRWTTGEISFIKDLLLHINDIKFDMTNRAKGYSAWFPTLKRMKDRKVNVADFRVRQLIPNSSLVISSYEVETLEQKYGIMIKDSHIAARLVDSLFLMALVILDEGSQTMDILYSDSNSFETYALETIQREVSLSSNRLASEIGRMISSSR